MSRPNVRTPANALRDITNKLPQKTVRNSKESSKQQKTSVTKQRQKGTLEKGTLDLNTKPNVEEEEIEYGPSPVEELPYEPFDEDLKFDWEPLRNMARVPSYEIENIELTFPKIDPDDYRSREVINDYELYGFDKVVFTDYDLGDENINEYEVFQFKKNP